MFLRFALPAAVTLVLCIYSAESSQDENVIDDLPSQTNPELTSQTFSKEGELAAFGYNEVSMKLYAAEVQATWNASDGLGVMDSVIVEEYPSEGTTRRRHRSRRQVYGFNVTVSNTIGREKEDCSLLTLCHEKLQTPYVCYYFSQACDGVQNCATGRDELYCDDPGLFDDYRRVEGIVPDEDKNSYVAARGHNLRGCARFCNDVYDGCLGFSFKSVVAGLGDCLIYTKLVPELKGSVNSVFYLRNRISHLPRLRPPSRALLAPRSFDAATANCITRQMYSCGKVADNNCLPYEKVCDGITHCSDDETVCNVHKLFFTKEEGYTSSRYSVPISNLSLAACAWFSIALKKIEFSYAPAQRECRITCSSCADATFLRDSGADHYSFSETKFQLARAFARP